MGLGLQGRAAIGSFVVLRWPVPALYGDSRLQCDQRPNASEPFLCGRRAQERTLLKGLVIDVGSKRCRLRD